MGRSYMIIEFTEGTIEEILEHAGRASFHSVYHGHQFHTRFDAEIEGQPSPRIEIRFKSRGQPEMIRLAGQ
jgi:hypothetical protein